MINYHLLYSIHIEFRQHNEENFNFGDTFMFYWQKNNHPLSGDYHIKI